MLLEGLKTRLLSSLAHLHKVLIARLGASTLGVRALVVDARDRILLVQHTYGQGWYLPGGGLERGETAEQGIERELREEVGLSLRSPPELFGVYVNAFRGINDFPIVFVVRDFTLSPVACPEIAAVDWFPLGQLPDGLSPGTRRRVNELLGASAKSGTW
jgi:8-oxo-dGTP pyrophosphatase MutT (NUDIX family)